jgi:hypothetical protein
MDLAPLRPIRMSQKVYIQCVQEDGLAEVLKISSQSTHSEFYIAEAIKGIRSVRADAKARAILATPKYFVNPPTANSMRSFISPKQIVTRKEVIGGIERKRNIMCIGTKQLGPKFSNDEQKTWTQDNLNQDDFARDFQSCLLSNLMELTPLKNQMRMRLTFGHVVLKKFPPQYPASQQSLVQFTRMLKHPLVRVEIDEG